MAEKKICLENLNRAHKFMTIAINQNQAEFLNNQAALKSRSLIKFMCSVLNVVVKFTTHWACKF